MHFTRAFSLLAIALAAPGFAFLAKRQLGPPGGLPITLLDSPGSITAPTNGTIITAGQPFTFDVAVPEFGHCHPDYTPVSVYVLAGQPTTSDLNSTYGFSNYLYYFGDYVVNNFPGPLPNMGTPPPSNLTLPDLGKSYSGQAVYLATIETIEGCPPNGFWEYAIDSIALSYIE
ncbi:uncharacterized protein PHACADRAFT_92472 [Phanerochaete carnosa HHB-10118-sp]|uniref:Ubiquitin 3 binding protein But2 C-terminal domain-containing protein n=1 Tax=Phanerochaete carnosa (strain HHB-10118-sp) TaxID=650164 RepID=K5X1R9_PHACS|nr:uncharacterized protein PHACADRAFT_92472 [Phanerochaete carnosa HHB-10118-sp]EKM56727.1 hypothetical protein PHACADRAFT_92472 [Phanerochaete carnosa HHB-10118-sp]